MRYPPVEILHWAKRKPKDLIDLSASEMPSPRLLADLGIRLEDIPLSGDNCYGYTVLKDVIADRYGIAPRRVTITPGTSMANFLVLNALLERGDKTAVEFPAYEPLARLSEFITGRKPLKLIRDRGRGYHLGELPEQIIEEQPNILILSNLHNPTGVWDPPETFITFAERVSEWGGWLLVDEVFLAYLPTGDEQTSAVSHHRIITTNSLSKAWGLHSLRIGWVIGPVDLVRRIELMTDSMYLILPFITEFLASKVLARKGVGTGLLAAAREKSRTNWEIVAGALARMPALDWVAPTAGISVLLRFRDERNSDAFCGKLSSEYGTLVVPGRFFGVEDGFRMSFGIQEPLLHRGLSAIEALLNDNEGWAQ